MHILWMYRPPSLSSSKGLGIPVSHDENAHHVDLHNPYWVPPHTSKAKPSPTNFCGIKYLLARARGSIANGTCRACAVPNIHMVHYHKLCPEFLSQADVSCNVLGESKLLQETVSDVSEYMLHETSITTDSGYHSPHPTVPAHLDASSGAKALVSTNKVPCPSSQGETLVNLPSKMDEILSPVLCKDTGDPEVKVPGEMLPSTSTPRVKGENINAASMFASFGESETFIEPSHPIPCNSIVCPIEGKVLPSPVEFRAQSMTASHPIGVDEDWKDYVRQASTYVQHTSAHNPAIISPDEPLNCPRLVLMAKGQPQ